MASEILTGFINMLLFYTLLGLKRRDVYDDLKLKDRITPHVYCSFSQRVYK